MPSDTFILRSRWVAPMSSSLIENGFVSIENGLIADVGSASMLPRKVDLDLGDSVLLPGLINAHTHLELSNQSQGEPPTSFGEWIWRIIERRIELGDAIDDDIVRATKLGAEESLRFGVTCVGDISRECRITRRVLRELPLRVVSFGEVQAMAAFRDRLDHRLETAVDSSLASDRLCVGVSPHAPFTVEPDAYCSIVKTAQARSMRICTHLAETLEEREFLAFGSGPLRELWNKLGTWDDRVPLVPSGPFGLARNCGLLDMPSLLAHVNYLNDEELAMLAGSQASVVFCPRTHAYFRHAPHRWREMLVRGINVCVGTDGKGSAPDLNVVDDLRLLHKQSPEVPAELLWQLVTTNAAKALRVPGVGAIEVGNVADLVAFPASGHDPFLTVLESHERPSHVMIAGDPLLWPA
jgi:cytosine/adenosine deaminase-related metal-dependent hydrolase